MKRSLKAALVSAVAVVTVTAVVPGSAFAASPLPSLSDTQIAAMAPADQAKLLNPLRALANAADAVGKAELAGVYAGLELNAGAHTVNIYLTDRSQAKRFLAAAKAADPGTDTNLARIKQAKYTRQALHEARDRVLGAKGEYGDELESVSVPSDGSGLRIGVKNVERAKQKVAASRALTASDPAGVDTVLEPSSEGSDMSRLRDTPAWIAGEALTDAGWGSGYKCTSGVPTRRKSDNRSFLISAAHCFSDGASVYTGWENGGRNYLGNVVARADLWDAVAIDVQGTGWTAGREWDGPVNNSFTLTLTSSAYSYNGDFVCQDGYTTGVMCGIKVVDDDKYWTGSNGVDHRGVEGTQVSGYTAIQGGDSGGLVFSITGDTRQARGINSWGGGTTIRWTEVVDIYNTWGLQLA
ncbi:hypothetical protein GCM10009639_08760 [Kitasatospora putterlickiae]|uniref:Uncharacterized protein n=1 Tax=Kitasatospora putterlickiae TaxID=221725 RepID=A0ABN1XMZ1_9ACTN